MTWRLCAIIRHVLSRIESDASVKNRFIRSNKEVARRKGCMGSSTQILNSGPLILPEKSAFCIIATALDAATDSDVFLRFLFHPG